MCPSEGLGMAKLWMERRVSDKGAGRAGAGDKGLLTFGWHSEPLAPLLRRKAHKNRETHLVWGSQMLLRTKLWPSNLFPSCC